jgi:hypothetical protein
LERSWIPNRNGAIRYLLSRNRECPYLGRASRALQKRREDDPRSPLRVKSEPLRHASFPSAVRGGADRTRRKRTNGRRSSAIGGIAVVAGAASVGLLLARSRSSLLHKIGRSWTGTKRCAIRLSGTGFSRSGFANCENSRRARFAVRREIADFLQHLRQRSSAVRLRLATGTPSRVGPAPQRSFCDRLSEPGSFPQEF